MIFLAPALILQYWQYSVIRLFHPQAYLYCRSVCLNGVRDNSALSVPNFLVHQPISSGRLIASGVWEKTLELSPPSHALLELTKIDTPAVNGVVGLFMGDQKWMFALSSKISISSSTVEEEIDVEVRHRRRGLGVVKTWKIDTLIFFKLWCLNLAPAGKDLSYSYLRIKRISK